MRHWRRTKLFGRKGIADPAAQSEQRISGRCDASRGSPLRGSPLIEGARLIAKRLANRQNALT